MNNMKMKPVWRRNTGNGVPSDFSGVVLLDDDMVLPYNITFSFIPFRRVEYGDFVIAYQTNRTKEAKVFMSICEDCIGSGNEIDWDDENCLPIENTYCQSCDGKGDLIEFIDGIKR